MAKLADASYFVQSLAGPPVGQWTHTFDLLNYPPEEKWPYQVELYDATPDVLNELDENAIAPLKSL